MGTWEAAGNDKGANRMTPDELQAIEARLAAITPGPWQVGLRKGHDGALHQAMVSAQYHDIAGPIATLDTGRTCIRNGVLTVSIHEAAVAADAAFIANAPADMAALLAEMRRLEAENAALTDAT